MLLDAARRMAEQRRLARKLSNPEQAERDRLKLHFWAGQKGLEA